MILTPRQCDQLGPFIGQDDQFTIFCVLVDSYVPAAGGSVLRSQFRSVPLQLAKKIVKLLRSSDHNIAANPCQDRR